MKQIELLLLDNVSNLGIVGDVVKVKPGYARNYLLPQGLAAPPTQGAIKKLAVRRAEVELQMKEMRSRQEQLIARLEGYEMTMLRSANEQGVLYAGVSQHEIAQTMRQEGYAIEDRFVRIGQQIKRLDSYEIPIVIEKDLSTQIKLWVVSDKPVEELEEADQGQDDAPQEVFPADLDLEDTDE